MKQDNAVTANCEARLDGLCAAIGRTPLLRLRRLSELSGCEILAKAEYMNPGGSVKDRAALSMVLAAERAGQLKPGGLIVEGTAGNTGIGLTLVGRARGYRMLAVLPAGLSEEKVALLRAVGAELRITEEHPRGHPEHYVALAERLASSTPGAWWVNQFDNTANRQAHIDTTAPEIWQQSGGRVTAFVAAVGSGGTLAGCTLGLRRFRPELVSACADPVGAAMYSWIKHSRPECGEGESVAEGVGQNRVTRNIEDVRIDEAFVISDRQAVAMQQHLLREEGIFVGLSAAINVCGAMRLAATRGRGQVIATILCDGGGRYVSRLFNRDWLGAHGLLPDGTEDFLHDLLRP